MMTDDMPDSIERPWIFAALEKRYRDPEMRQLDLDRLEEALADPGADLRAVRQAMLVDAGATPADVNHVLEDWYGNGWYWDFLPEAAGPLSAGSLPAGTAAELRAARAGARGQLTSALASGTALDADRQRALVRLMVGENGPASAGRKFTGEDRARVYAHGMVEFLRAIARVVASSQREPALQIRWICEGKPNQFETYIDWSQSHVSLMVLTPKVVDYGLAHDPEFTLEEMRLHCRGTVIVRANPELGGSRTVVATPRLYRQPDGSRTLPQQQPGY
jgi:hypothetical protein